LKFICRQLECYLLQRTIKSTIASITTDLLPIARFTNISSITSLAFRCNLPLVYSKRNILYFYATIAFYDILTMHDFILNYLLFVLTLFDSRTW
jgi:hypothetical protein